MSTTHVRCVTCGDPATHVVAYLRPAGLAPKHYAYCTGCDDSAYYALTTPLTRQDGGPLFP